MAAYGLSVELGEDGGENQKAKSRYGDFPMVASLFCALLLDFGELTWKKNIKKCLYVITFFPHERFPLDKLLTKAVLKKADYFIVHAKSDGDDLLSIKPNAQFRQNPHPTYHAFQVRNLSKEQARQELHKTQEEKLLLFFGFVREYKGLKHLLQAMPIIRQQLENVKLMVVGAFGSDKEDYLTIIREHHLEQNIEVIDGYTPDHEVEKYFAGCDLVVLPYESATQSGIVQIAYGFEKPVIVTNVGGLPDVVIEGKTGYIVPSQQPKALAEAIVRYFQLQKEQEFTKQMSDKLLPEYDNKTTRFRRYKNLPRQPRHQISHLRLRNNPYREGHPSSCGECPRMSCLQVDYPYIFCVVSLRLGS